MTAAINPMPDVCRPIAPRWPLRPMWRPAEALRRLANRGDRFVDPADLLRLADELDTARATDRRWSDADRELVAGLVRAPSATRPPSPAPTAHHPPTAPRRTTMPADPARDFAADLHRRIAAVLADLDRTEPLDPGRIHAGTDCWRWHAVCLADRIRRTLTEETA